jgi:hypothetical protein
VSLAGRFTVAMEGVERSDEVATEARSVDSKLQMNNAIRAISSKKPIPDIDFTLHTMEDGSQVNTTERVCKGRRVRASCAG